MKNINMKNAFFAACSVSLLFALSGCKVEKTQDGAMPEVEVTTKAGQLPEYEVETAKVEVGTKTVEVEVPTASVEMPSDSPSKPAEKKD